MDLHAVAAMCNGYVGADIQALCREAAMSALQNSLQCKGEERLKSVGMEDWQEAHRKVGPSIVRGAAAEIPQVSWEDIGGLHELTLDILLPIGPVLSLVVLTEVFRSIVCLQRVVKVTR